MPIEVKCECGRRLRARDELAGKRAKCPACGMAVRIPAIPVPLPAPGVGLVGARETFPTHAPDVRMKKPAPAPPEPVPARLKKPAPPPPEPVPASVGVGAPDPYALDGDGGAAEHDPFESFPGFPPLPHEPAVPPPPPAPTIARKRPAAAAVASKRAQPALKPLLAEDQSPNWFSLTAPAAGLRRFTYLLLALAILPLVVHTISPHETLLQRLTRTVQSHPDVMSDVGTDERMTHAELRQVLRELPGHKLDGALLPYKTSTHYLYALISAACFMGLGLWMMPGRTTKPLSVFLVGLFTGTLGIILLLIVQFLAVVFSGHIIIPRSIVGVVILILQLIGLSYRAALNPDNSFLLSFIGFTFGVGLCEEFCKAMPVLWNFKSRASLDWRGAFQWGLLSGVGFGVSEGITYAADYYNGVESGGIYLVRFVSCVALHAAWAAAAGVSIYRRQDRIQMAENAFGFFGNAILLISVPIVLHGLYDTMLKKEMDVAALFVALLSFAYLAFEVESVRRMEDRGVLPQIA